VEELKNKLIDKRHLLELELLLVYKAQDRTPLGLIKKDLISQKLLLVE
jgi:hypothetical protein